MALLWGVPVSFKIKHEVSPWCEGELCRICGEPAAHKVEEVVDHEEPPRHPYVAYLCCFHFVGVVGDAAKERCLVDG